MSKQTWYSITAAAKANGGESSADIYIFDEIGMWGVSARDFINEVRALDVDNIDLHMNSGGGDVFDGIAIQNILKMHRATVVAHIDGLAASIASVIVLGADRVLIGDNAYVMIHNPTAWIWGEAEDMAKGAELLDKISDGIAADYAKKMDITVEAARVLMDAETWYLGQEAVDAGFADATYTGVEIAASFDLKTISNKAPADAVALLQKKPGKPENKIPTEGKAMTDKEKAAKAEAEAKAKGIADAKVATEKAEADAKAEAEKAEIDNAKGADVKAAVQAALVTDRKRTSAINELGEKFGFVAEAKEFSGSEKTVDEFREHVLAKSPDQWRNSLAIKNPADSNDDVSGDGDDNDELREKVLARRKARNGGR